MDLPVRCSICKKIAFYLPTGYSLNIDIKCVSCHEKKHPPKEKKTNSNVYSKIKKGIREDVHKSYFFRSPTEANFARILKSLKIKWKYENKLFTFDGYKRKPFSYLMDFEITEGNSRFPAGYYEIKGYMNSQSRQKLRRFKKHYPEESNNTTIVIYSKYNKKDIAFCESLNYKYMFYDVLSKEFDALKNWEGKKKK